MPTKPLPVIKLPQICRVPSQEGSREGLAAQIEGYVQILRPKNQKKTNKESISSCDGAEKAP